MIPRKRWYIVIANGWVIFRRPRAKRIWHWLGEPMNGWLTAIGPFESEQEAVLVLEQMQDEKQ